MIYDILILGAGWTSTFLIPLLKDEKLKYAATSTTGRDDTIKWKFTPPSDDKEEASTMADSYKSLPDAHVILITFPLTGKGQSKALVDGYVSAHGSIKRPNFIQLGSTGIWQSSSQGADVRSELWITKDSPYDRTNARAQAEDELREHAGGVILNLSGLWGGPERQPRNFVDRIFKSKADVRQKGSLHMIHGQDVARAIVAVMRDWPGASRWMLTDGFVYDWWALLAGWGDSSRESTSVSKEGGESNEKVRWVFECMEEAGVRALPRSMEALGRCYDARDFWRTFRLVPSRARI